MRKTLVLGTRNRKKLGELRRILEDLPLELKSPEDFPEVPEVEETGLTFEENAILKATAVAQATGCRTLADDSGLEVEALEGRPGICSSRCSGTDGNDATNRAHLMRELEGVPSERRSARFVCVVAVCAPTGDPVTFRGECEGVILEEERGTQGFGYDPMFWVPAFGLTMAELSPEVKNRISHRARALDLAKAHLAGGG